MPAWQGISAASQRHTDIFSDLLTASANTATASDVVCASWGHHMDNWAVAVTCLHIDLALQQVLDPARHVHQSICSGQNASAVSHDPVVPADGSTASSHASSKQRLFVVIHKVSKLHSESMVQTFQWCTHTTAERDCHAVTDAAQAPCTVTIRPHEHLVVLVPMISHVHIQRFGIMCCPAYTCCETPTRMLQAGS